MASRTIAPLRSLRSVVSRQAAPRVAAGRFVTRGYSTEEAAGEVKESPELAEAKKRATELEEKVKTLEVSGHRSIFLTHPRGGECVLVQGTCQERPDQSQLALERGQGTEGLTGMVLFILRPDPLFTLFQPA